MGRREDAAGAQPSAFTLTHSTGTPGGLLLTRHARTGALHAGSFGEAG